GREIRPQLIARCLHGKVAGAFRQSSLPTRKRFRARRSPPSPLRGASPARGGSESLQCESAPALASFPRKRGKRRRALLGRCATAPPLRVGSGVRALLAREGGRNP